MSDFADAVVEQVPDYAVVGAVDPAAARVYVVSTLPSSGGDTVPPVVSNFSPPAGSAIGATTAVSFDVTDETSLARVFVLAEFLGGTYEVIHDGAKFGSRYAPASSRSAIAGGYHYSVRRNGGWPQAMTVRVIPLDRAGQEG